ncbi:nitronate monooxygenase [Streptomyces sp. 303MFCol5.2]|uniref:nitronate monooxygenase n=1 Tax=Streptomyces sp. 303MFCol5.2 TaxID=1172181 RepID=UPI0022771CAD|nr:nitronate monooxygenase [Streptomyces sp. 303MFCol5.2]
MTLSTAFTELFGVRHPIASAPMGGSAGGALTAAVSRGGGLGLLGSGDGDRAWLSRELPLVTEGATGPWGGKTMTRGDPPVRGAAACRPAGVTPCRGGAARRCRGGAGRR